MKTLSRAAHVLIAGVIALALVLCRADAQTMTEHQVKAAFLMNFAKFIEWPAVMFETVNTPITIGIIGDDPFDTALDEAVRGKAIDGHRILVKHVRIFEDWSKVHILFVSDSEKNDLRKIFERLGDAPVLTVSDIQSFCRSGGTIGFVTEHNRVRFEISLEAAERSGLLISSKLLTLATNVYKKGD
jgi:hypothetical protein